MQHYMWYIKNKCTALSKIVKYIIGITEMMIHFVIAIYHKDNLYVKKKDEYYVHNIITIVKPQTVSERKYAKYYQ